MRETLSYSMPFKRKVTKPLGRAGPELDGVIVAVNVTVVDVGTVRLEEVRDMDELRGATVSVKAPVELA
jgi:hypothetical protein